MDACFSSVGRSRRKQKSVTVEHHYRVDIFTAIIDQQLQELNIDSMSRRSSFLS